MPPPSRVADILLEEGRNAARAREATGQLWGQTVANLGQLPNQIVAERAAAQERGLRQQSVRLGMAEHAARLQEMQDARMDDGLTAQLVQANSHLDPDSGHVVIDHDAVNTGLVGKGRMKAAERYMDFGTKYEERINAIQNQHLATEHAKMKLRADALGHVAEAPEDQRAGLYATMRGTLSPLMQNDPVLGKLPAVYPGHEAVTTLYQQQLTDEQRYARHKEAAALAKTQAETKKLTAETEGTLPASPAQKETARYHTEELAIRRRAEAETEREHRAEDRARDPLAALTGSTGALPGGQTPAGAMPTGEEFLKRLPDNVANEVKAYAEGRRPFPAGFALKSPYFQSLIQMVSQYDPTFDAVNYNARSKTRSDFTSGKSAQTINALNTVTQHLQKLSTSVDALHNSWSPTYNTLANFLSRKSGSPIVTNFETDKKAVVDELTRAWRQSGGTEHDIKSWETVLDASNSPDQLHGAIGQMVDLLEGKLQAMEAQYQQGMGTTDTTGLQMVTPAARQAMDRLKTKAGRGGSTKPAVSAEELLKKYGGR